MNPVFPARRRAEQFSSMVEDSSTGLRDTELTGKHADLLPLVGVVTSLRATPAPAAARPEFVADLRGRLMLAAETALAPDTAEQVDARRPAPRRTPRERRLAVAIGGFALVTASTSMSVAAQGALPGDTLYPLKRALEDAHETVVRDADDKGSAMLGNASGRLDEVDELSRSDGQDPDVIAETLQDFTDQAVEASDVLLGDYAETGQLSSIEELQTFTTQSLDALELLEGLVPPEARASLIEATRALDTIIQRTLAACLICDPAALLPDISRAPGLGPLDEALDAAPRRPDAPVAAQQPVKRDRPTRPPTAGSDPAPVDPPVAAEPEEEEPEAQEPVQPKPPRTPPAGGGTPVTPNPLNGVVTDIGDPLGDLLTGLGETVDNLLAPPGKPQK